jgi:Zn-dependent M28 family amino/carboxypeptidase
MSDNSLSLLSAQLRKDVVELAEVIGERNVWLPEKLAAAREFIEGELGASGYAVSRQGYSCEGREVYNLEVELPGTARPDEVLIVGAHYDSRCGMSSTRGRERDAGEPGTPGANDNGSGIASVLALARAFANRPQPRTLRFVAFVNEEPPFFQTPQMGSWVYAKRCRSRGEKLLGMITPETLGCYLDADNSQRYPFPYNWMGYSSIGNFVAFLSNRRSRPLLNRVQELFERHTNFPCHAVAIPTLFRRIGWSDDWAFWQEGYHALAVTDTAYLRYPYYHTTEDTPEKLNYEHFAIVVDALVKVVEDLVGVDTSPAS